jgi:hypothetical protein
MLAPSIFLYLDWIRVIQLTEWANKLLRKPVLSVGLASLASLVIPVILIQQNYDDHDRSNRYQQVDFAKNLLNSCEKNAILFTAGDNDTFRFGMYKRWRASVQMYEFVIFRY